MTETSFFWDGTTVGDATLATYDADEIASALGTVIGDFVIPYTYVSTSKPSQELLIGLSAVVGKVSVGTGAAFVKGVMYVLDADTTVDIASNAAGNPRIDRVVLRRTTAAQTVRLTVIAGTPGAAPSAPAITTATDMSLAWIWVEDGYDALADNISSAEIHDERVFREIGPSHQISARKNLLKNAEFIGVSLPAGSAFVSNWKLIGPPTIGFNTTTFRGRHLVLTTTAAADGIETTVSCNQVFADDSVFTLTGYLDCTGGEVTLNLYRVNLSTGASTLERTQTFRPTGNIARFTLRDVISTAQDAIRVTLVGVTGGGGDVVRMGEFVLSEGYHTNVVYNHEIIWLDQPLTDAGWTASAKSTGLTTIDLASSFGSYIMPYIRGVILRVRCRDSGSGAAADTFDTAVTIHHVLDAPPSTNTAVGVVSCAGNANNDWEEQVMFVPIDITDLNAPFKVYVYASGAGTLDATIEVLGIVT